MCIPGTRLYVKSMVQDCTWKVDSLNINSECLGISICGNFGICAALVFAMDGEALFQMYGLRLL